MLRIARSTSPAKYDSPCFMGKFPTSGQGKQKSKKKKGKSDHEGSVG